MLVVGIVDVVVECVVVCDEVAHESNECPDEERVIDGRGVEEEEDEETEPMSRFHTSKLRSVRDHR